MNKNRARVILEHRPILDNEFLFAERSTITDRSLSDLFDYISNTSNVDITITNSKNVMWNDYSNLMGDAFIVKVEKKESSNE